MGGFTPEGGEGLRVQAKQTFARTDTLTLTHTYHGRALVCLVCLRSLRACVARVVNKGEMGR